MFKIGDKIKLKNYYIHADYERHNNQIGIIYAKMDGGRPGYIWAIRWKDGDTSAAMDRYLILAEEVKSEIKVYGVVNFLKNIERSNAKV